MTTLRKKIKTITSAYNNNIFPIAVYYISNPPLVRYYCPGRLSLVLAAPVP